MRSSQAWTVLLGAALLLLAGFSTYLSITRIYQVDECQTVFMARVSATGQSGEFFTTSSLFLFGPLSWLTQSPLSSASLFTGARLLFWVVFWTNLLLIAGIASGKLFSFRGVVALLGAATLAPLWDYGFEIRHDNLVLTGILAIWWSVRVRPMGYWTYVLAGAVTATLLFTAVKTVVYAIPLSFAILAFPPPNFKQPRWRLVLVWLAGVGAAVITIRIGYGPGEAWNDYLSVLRVVTQYSAESAAGGGSNTQFFPWVTLGRLLPQTPLLLALVLAANIAWVAEALRRGRQGFSWTGLLPELLLLWGALAALLANPTPFPYNLVHVVPYAYLLAFKYGADLWEALSQHASLWPLAGSILVLAHLSPFVVATLRHLNWPNDRQRQLIELSEAMTDPKHDRVYDSIGMVPTRPSIHFQWYLHSLNIRWMLNTPGMRLREMLAARPATVFIPSYRTDWLPAEDHDFIKQHYVPLADDFWVLGTVLPPGGGDFEIIHSGRYCITWLSTNQPAGGMEVLAVERTASPSLLLDGRSILQHLVKFELGSHHIESSNPHALAVVWVGPTLSEIPSLSPGNHRSLFTNWY